MKSTPGQVEMKDEDTIDVFQYCLLKRECTPLVQNPVPIDQKYILN